MDNTMTAGNASQSSTKESPKFGKTIRNDLHRGDFKRTFRREMRDIYQVYLDDETRDRLSAMGRFRRAIFLAWLVLKSMFFKLTPFRRILLLVSVALFFTDSGKGFDGWKLGFSVLLFVLILELKDKLLAQEEIEAGRAVQSALIPDHNPTLSGWEVWLYTRPANEIGGDLVDYLMVDKERLGVALGDVAGKGLGAALLMAKLQATIRAIASSFKSLAELGAQINEIFCRDSLPNRFASLIYLELGPGSRRVRLLNAGHLPPISIHGDSLREMPRGGTALGIMPDADYSEEHVDLQSGDLLLAYSDGLIEARNEQGDFFGEQHLMDILPRLRGLSAEAAGGHLLAEVDIFVGEAPRSDDLSLVLLKHVS
jgi:hypothetical protein